MANGSNSFGVIKSRTNWSQIAKGCLRHSRRGFFIPIRPKKAAYERAVITPRDPGRLGGCTVNAEQMSSVMSGDPVLMGQKIIEIVVGVPVVAYEWIADWLD